MQTAQRATFVAASGLLAFSLWQSPQALTSVPQMVGSAIVGVSAAVSPNEDNMLAAQLAAREDELNARERALSSRGVSSDEYARYSLLASMGLFALLSLNFFFDWRRTRTHAAA